MLWPDMQWLETHALAYHPKDVYIIILICIRISCHDGWQVLFITH
jgi:hypothetical protein